MMMNVGLHPHVIGVPHRAGILRKFLAYAKQFDRCGGRRAKKWRPAIASSTRPTFHRSRRHDAGSVTAKFRTALQSPAVAAAIVVALVCAATASAESIARGRVRLHARLDLHDGRGRIHLTIGVLNFLNFTIPTLFMLTGMVAWGLMANGYVKFAGGWAWLAALAAGVAAAVAASLLVERFTFRYLKMKHGDAIEHAIPLVSSLGFLLIFEHLVLIALGSESERFAIPFKADMHLAGWSSVCRRSSAVRSPSPWSPH